MHPIIYLMLSGLLLSSIGWAKPNWVEVRNLRPTQFAVGQAEIEIRQKEIQEMNDDELISYLKKKVGRVVIGPGGEYWLIDGHHLAIALNNEDYPEMLIETVRDWSKLGRREFFKRMQNRKWFWLYDEKGRGPLSPERLPKTIRGLKDDPYRSLAWFVKKQGGFNPTETPYAEFLWGNFFRSRIPEEDLTERPRFALRLAMLWAQSSLAKHLPGYIGDDDAICARLLLEKK